MKRLVCETCGGTDLVKDGETYVCKRCGSRYAAHEQKVVVTVVDQRGDDKSQKKDRNQNPAQDKVEKPSGIKETNPAIRSIVYDASRTFRANEYGNYYGGGAIEAAEKLDGYADRLSELDPYGGFEWYVRASSVFMGSTAEDDRIEEAVDLADRAFRAFMGKLPEITDLELKAIGDVFDFPARLVSMRVYIHVKKSPGAIDAHALDQCLGAWRAKVFGLYSSWNKDYIVEGKMPEKLSLAIRKYWKIDADGYHRIILAFAVLADLKSCDGMVCNSYVADLSNGLEERFKKEQDAFRAESRRIRDELFGSSASSAERTLFEKHADALDDMERWSREVTRMLDDGAESVDAFVSCVNHHSRSYKENISGSSTLIYRSCTASVRILMARRHDCAQRLVEGGVPFAKNPSWIVGEEQGIQLEAQIEELKERMRERDRDLPLGTKFSVLNLSYREEADKLTKIENEIATLKSASLPTDYDGMATDLAFIGERQSEAAQIQQELHSTSLFDIKRQYELRSRMKEVKDSIASRENEINRRVEEERKAFELYRRDRLETLESQKRYACKKLDAAERHIEEMIDAKFIDDSHFSIHNYYGLPALRYSRFSTKETIVNEALF